MTHYLRFTALPFAILLGLAILTSPMASAQDTITDSDTEEVAEGDKASDQDRDDAEASDEKGDESGEEQSDEKAELTFGGDLSELAAELPEFVTIKVRRQSNVVGRDGAVEKQTFYERQTVKPEAEDLTAEQRLGVFVAVLEDQIQENLVKLKNTSDDDEKKEIMASLEQQFKDRYAFDTAYQDFKAKELEAKSAELRAEVDAREKAADGWVKAMVTLVKAKVDGIETMDMSVLTEADSRSSEPSIASPSDSGTSL